MHPLLRRSVTATLLAAASLVGGCSEDSSDPTSTAPAAPFGVAAASTTSASVRLTFTGTGQASDRYVIERAPGSGSATFSEIATVDGGASGSVSYEDTGLDPAATYRYRIATLRGTTRSAYSTILDVTTGAIGAATATISADITASRTLSRDTTYVLRGFIHVKAPAVLTIQAGTTIKGDYDTQGSSLFILPGARIVAVGTAALPIVFTSSRPVGQRAPGDWGGLAIIGNGVINRAGAVELEGSGTVTTGEPTGQNYRLLYSGGTNNADNSGELRYVRIEYAGYAIAPGAELNAFTFAAVGSGTRLSYLQALQGLDDSFEWFGGAADADHLVSYDSGDDHFDMSEGYQGRLQYLIAFQDTVLSPSRASAGGASGDPTGIENDGCAAPSGATPCTNGFDATPFNIPVVANFTLVGTTHASAGIGMVLRRGTGGHYVNGLIARWPRAGISLRDSATIRRAGSTTTPDIATSDLLVRNVLVAESPVLFETGSGRVFLDEPANALTRNGTATLATLFTRVPANASATTTAADFDWTPASGSAAASGGFSTFSGKLATRVAAPLASGNGTVSGTSYVGAAAPGGPKWWEGWTAYAQQ